MKEVGGQQESTEKPQQQKTTAKSPMLIPGEGGKLKR
jgi:hypothetical protein